MSNKRFQWNVTIEEEIARYPQLKMEDVITIREWMATQPHFPKVDDETIGQFLYACYFDLEHVKQTIELFMTYKSSMPEFSHNWDITSPQVRDVGENLYIVLLPGLDQDGNQIILCKLNNMLPAQYIFSECIKWIMMTVFLNQIEHGIRPGYTLVYDADGYTVSHLFKNPLSQVKNYILFGQNASSIRVTGIRFINSSMVIKQLINLVRPFLNQDVMKMLSVHTSSQDYFKNIQREIVPVDYGGEAPSLDELSRRQREKMAGMRHIIMKNEEICADESKREKKVKKQKEVKKEENSKAEESETINTSFKRLELD
ncbi:alpha-tocopherol transfer protein-like isoform X1 [Lycorma delicatula]|uniref:alpha-tocopherol transfer protein-like isoform X1 n=1 Tax=Lycorma delicatula TaxID=130591 RepID=UPI003F5146EE